MMGTSFASVKSLVVTTIDIDPVFPEAGTNRVYITTGPQVAAVGGWSVPNNMASQFMFQSGIVFPPGSAVVVVNRPARLSSPWAAI